MFLKLLYPCYTRIRSVRFIFSRQGKLLEVLWVFPFGDLWFFLYSRQAWVLKTLCSLQTRMGFGSFFLGGGASTTCLFSQTHFLHRVFLLRTNFSCFYITTMMMKTMVTNTLMIMKMMVISMIETTIVMVMIMMMELVGRCSKAWYKPANIWYIIW